MADAEKLMALKRAYADIILNSAKEAAARIMMSERKALRFQQELRAAKDESLRVLLRMKQMMDFKEKEAEMTSLTQQKKIEELEAQLHEAEDIVKDLREELREVHAEKEKLKINQLQHLNEQGLKSDPTTLEERLQENNLTSFGSIMLPPDTEYEPTTSSDMIKLTQRYEGIKCCSANGSHAEVSHSSKPNFDSIIMRRKEPELYRNGCTQRIRAFEENVLDGKPPLEGQADDEKIETFIREDEEGGCTTPTPRTDNLHMLATESILVLQENKSRKVRAVRSSRRKRKGASAARYKKLKAPAKLGKTNAQAGEILSAVTIDDVKKYPSSCLPSTLRSVSDDTVMQSKSVDENQAKILKCCSVQDETTKVKGLVDYSGEESESAENSEAPVDLVKADVPLVESDSKSYCTANRVSSQAKNDMFLKYTFTRKRKRESLSNRDENDSLEGSVPKKKGGEKQIGSLEPQKSSLVIESTRDSRRLAQVARQLISLSEKRW